MKVHMMVLGLLESSWKENQFIQTPDGLDLTKMPLAN